ncbi:MAG TPA: PqqD family protein [Pyrinomonadaceae bacterium]|nr:PqqD family protein [Pyrinomonadaceae bacterium]
MTTTGFAPHEHVVFTEFDAGEGILVDLNTKKYFQLNETALIVWRGIENDKTLVEIVGEITAAYDVTPERATESVQRLLENLSAFKLVRRR